MDRPRTWSLSLGVGLTSPTPIGTLPGMSLRLVTSRAHAWGPAVGIVATADLRNVDHDTPSGDLRSRTTMARAMFAARSGGAWTTTLGVTFGGVWRPVWRPFWNRDEGFVRDQLTWAGGLTAMGTAPLWTRELRSVGLSVDLDLLILPIDGLVRPVGLGTAGLAYRW